MSLSAIPKHHILALVHKQKPDLVHGGPLCDTIAKHLLPTVVAEITLVYNLLSLGVILTSPFLVCILVDKVQG